MGCGGAYSDRRLTVRLLGKAATTEEAGRRLNVGERRRGRRHGRRRFRPPRIDSLEEEDEES
jgi:hypothetical protein